MKVLFVPYHGGPISHGIPLLALDRMLDDTDIETSFLIPGLAHQKMRDVGASVLNIDHYGFRTEMEAYGYFRPDVVVDDTSITTGYASALARLPRIAIQRTGIFPGATPGNPKHQHSLGLDIKKISDVTMLKLAQPQSLSDLFQSPIKIIPGVRSVEVLPPHLQDDPSYFYSGPLLIEDYLIASHGGTSPNDSQQFDALQRFFDSNSNRKIVYATLGTVAQSSESVLNCLKFLLDNDTAIISSIKISSLNGNQQELYFYADYLPMHYVCSRVDLMIHHCGSGTYQYPIIHNLPAITIGTKCYDREDVAMRLQEVGASIHIAMPGECEDFAGAFKNAVDRYFESSGAFISETRKNLAALNAEVKETTSSFNFQSVLNKAIHSAKVSA